MNTKRFSKNGQWFAYSTFFGDFLIASLNSDETKAVNKDVIDFVWNYKGDLLYIIEQDNLTGMDNLNTYDYQLNKASTVLVAESIVSAVPSIDETKVFYQGEFKDSQTSESYEGLWLYDVASASAIEITVPSSLSTRNQQIAWSNNNEYIAFVNDSNGGELFIYHVLNHQLTLIDSDFSNGNKIEWSPNNTALIYDKFQNNEKLFIYDTQTFQSNPLPFVNDTNRNASFSPKGDKLAYTNGCCELYVYDLNSLFNELIYSSDIGINKLKWNETYGIILDDNNQELTVISPAGSFIFNDAQLNLGINQFHTIARNDSGIPSAKSLPIIINVETSDLTDIQIESNGLVVSPKSAIQGTHFIASAEVTNNSQQMLFNAEVLIILTKPGGSTESIVIPQSNLSMQAQESQSLFIDLGLSLIHI